VGPLRQGELPLRPRRTSWALLLPLLARRGSAEEGVRPAPRPGAGQGPLRGTPAGQPRREGRLGAVARLAGQHPRIGASMNEIVARGDAAPETPDVEAMARHLANAFREKVDRYKYELGVSAQEAVAKAEEPCPLSRALAV